MKVFRNKPKRTNTSTRTIVCHSFPAWDTPYVKSTIELMTRLASSHRVVFVDYHYTLKDLLKNPHTPKKRVLGLKSRIRKERTKFGTVEVVSSPPIIPSTFISNERLFKLVSAVNGFIIGIWIKWLKKKLNLNYFTLVNAFNPVYGQMTKKYWNAERTIYYCYDEIAGTNWSGKHGPAYEKAFMKDVDLVVTSSKKLQEKKSNYNSNCKLVPNGVNLDIFQSVPKHHSKTRSIGYVGAIDDRIDFELIKHLQDTLPNHTFDFYGPVKTIIPEVVQKRLNLHGSVPQDTLPEHIGRMDLCIIPFVKNELTAAIYPLKINEYLAMGKPVVSTDFADLTDFKNQVGVSKNPEEFEKEIRKQLKFNSRLKAHKRITFAQRNSWNQRSNMFSRLLCA